MKELDRWTTASSNCLGYAPDDGELVKFEDAMEIITPLREALQQIMGLDEVSGYSDTYRIAADATNAKGIKRWGTLLKFTPGSLANRATSTSSSGREKTKEKHSPS